MDGNIYRPSIAKKWWKSLDKGHVLSILQHQAGLNKDYLAYAVTSHKFCDRTNPHSGLVDDTGSSMEYLGDFYENISSDSEPSGGFSAKSGSSTRWLLNRNMM